MPFPVPLPHLPCGEGFYINLGAADTCGPRYFMYVLLFDNFNIGLLVGSTGVLVDGVFEGLAECIQIITKGVIRAFLVFHGLDDAHNVLVGKIFQSIRDAGYLVSENLIGVITVVIHLFGEVFESHSTITPYSFGDFCSPLTIFMPKARLRGVGCTVGIIDRDSRLYIKTVHTEPEVIILD